MCRSTDRLIIADASGKVLSVKDADYAAPRNFALRGNKNIPSVRNIAGLLIIRGNHSIWTYQLHMRIRILSRKDTRRSSLHARRKNRSFLVMCTKDMSFPKLIVRSSIKSSCNSRKIYNLLNRSKVNVSVTEHVPASRHFYTETYYY